MIKVLITMMLAKINGLIKNPGKMQLTSFWRNKNMWKGKNLKPK